MYEIYHDLPIKAAPQAVFDAIALPEHLINWWPLKCSGQVEEGSTYNFYFTPRYDWYGHVTQSEPGRVFAIKMTKSDADWDNTTFGFDLQLEGNGTYMKFWHKGWPENNRHFRRSSYCWAILLEGLKNYVEKGTIIPFPDRQ